eukprot:TRINITY_DN3138_c1_g1_i4.p1 TRINITY_DN3138_c1_g1~~TRINITY_DN3138_c1_g1_i4.p1  ORF type:complete len:386 (-),score=89.36 TRINITY_DN3138_c1_g1_i4:198-1229(-)
MALHEEEQKKYEAIVQRVNVDGSYLIMWAEDGSGDETCQPESMELKESIGRKLPFQAGDAIEGLYHEENKWYAGRVKSVNDGGKYTVVWDEDDEEYDLEPKDLRKPLIKMALEDLEPGQKLVGRAGRTFDFGTFIDVGAEKEGLCVPFHQFEGDEAKNFREGDQVQALYEDEPDPYEATVQKDNKDGTYLITWDEDGEEYTCKKEAMRMHRVKELEEGSSVEVFVESVTTANDGTKRLGLALVESKLGARPARKTMNLEPFEKSSPNDWLKGEVVNILSFGAIVKVPLPDNSDSATGLLHITEVKNAFIENLEDELEVGQEVDVCVKGVDKSRQRLSLSMKGC